MRTRKRLIGCILCVYILSMLMPIYGFADTTATPVPSIDSPETTPEAEETIAPDVSPTLTPTVETTTPVPSPSFTPEPVVSPTQETTTPVPTMSSTPALTPGPGESSTPAVTTPVSSLTPTPSETALPAPSETMDGLGEENDIAEMIEITDVEKQMRILEIDNDVQSATRSIERKATFLVGMQDYPGTYSDLDAVRNDIHGMMAVLDYAGYDCTGYLNLSKPEFAYYLNQFISQLSPSDTLTFVYSGHGADGGYLCSTDNQLISVEELESMLSQHLGPKTVIIDACFSGDVIEKSINSDRKSLEQDFNADVITAFMDTKEKSRSLIGNEYKVLTSCRGDETSITSYFYLPDSPFAKQILECYSPTYQDHYEVSLFLFAFMDGFSAFEEDPFVYYGADANDDLIITLHEMYSFTHEWVIPDHDVQVYPMNDPYILYEDDDRNYNFDPNTGMIHGYHGSLTDLEIPMRIRGVPVIGISDGAFQNNTRITSVRIHQYIKVLGSNVFKGCTSLQEVIIEDGVTQIGQQFFSGCSSLTTVQWPATITVIPEYTFYQCASLSSVTVSGIVDVGNYAFYECTNLETILLNVAEQIGEYSFYGCTKLRSINPVRIKTIGAYAFAECTSLESGLGGSSIETIGRYAYKNCDRITQIQLYSSSVSMAEYAFYDCDGITTIKIENGAAAIGDYAFYHCDSLSEAWLGGTQFDIGEYAFSECVELLYVRITSGIRVIGEGAFKNNIKMKGGIFLPPSLESIKADAFYGCSQLSSFPYSDALIEIGDRAFYGCSSLSIYDETVIPSGVQTIGNSAFENCTSIYRIIFRSGVMNVGASAFRNCTNLMAVDLPDSLEVISDSAFRDCTRLNNVSLSSNLLNIGEAAFMGCTAMSNLSFGQSVQTIGRQAFSGCTALGTISLPTGLTDIADFAFDGCTNLVLTSIPSGVRSVGASAFRNCDSIVNMTLSEGIETLGVRAFYDCDQLTTVVFPSTLRSISDQVFEECALLQSPILNQGLIQLGYRAFYNCDAITEVTIPGTVQIQSLDTEIFYDCDNLQSATLEQGVPRISIKMFYSCDSLHTIIVGSSVIEVGDYAFYRCTNITSIDMPGVIQYWRYSFYGCSSLRNIHFYEGLERIWEGAFSGTAIESLVFPDSMNEADGSAFSYCNNLWNVTIGAGLETLHDGFRFCDGLLEFHVNPLNQHFSEIDHVLFNKDQTALLEYPEGRTEASYTIPDGTEVVEGLAFHANQNLTSIHIPSSVHTIRNESSFFSMPGKLEQFVVDLDNATFSTVDGVLFSKDMVRLLHYPQYKTTMSFTVPNTVQIIEDSAFERSQYLTDLQLPTSLLRIEEYAFEYNASISTITIPSSVTYIGKGAFFHCFELSEVILPDGLQEINQSTFLWCEELNSIRLPSSITRIEANVFTFCGRYGGIDIYLPKLLSYMSYSAFDDTTVRLHGYSNTYGESYAQKYDYEFNIIDDPHNIYIDLGNGTCRLTGYTGEDQDMIIPNVIGSLQVTEIAENAYQGLGISSVKLSSNNTRIGANAFRDNALTELSIPNAVVHIGSGAFNNNQINELNNQASNGLIFQRNGDGSIDNHTIVSYGGSSNIVDFIPEGVTRIGDEAFQSCSIGSVDLPDSLEWVGTGAFQDNELYYIHLGSRINYVGPSAFRNNQLSTFRLGDGLTTLPDNVFADNMLKTILLPSSVTSIGAGAFSNNGTLQRMMIPPEVVIIGSNAYAGCPANMTIHGHNESHAQSYAESNGILFVPYNDDVNDDGTIDMLDIVSVAQNYNSNTITYDLNLDNIVNLFDLMMIANRIEG